MLVYQRVVEMMIQSDYYFSEGVETTNQSWDSGLMSAPD
jgi:hypothetical protein